MYLIIENSFKKTSGLYVILVAFVWDKTHFGLFWVSQLLSRDLEVKCKKGL